MQRNKQDGSTQVLQPAHTRRLKPEPMDAAAVPAPGDTAPCLEWHGETHTGSVRGHNEDYYFCHAINDTGLFVVADGMGGHEAGEVASRLAVETLCRELRDAAEKQGDPLRLLERSVQQANQAVMHEARRLSSSMGTTLGVVFVTESTAYIANVGDSRTYRISNGSISQVTEDHSLVAKLVAAGKLSREEARDHPQSNLLYRCVGSDKNMKVDTFRVDLHQGDCLVLCTDGLWGEVTDEDLHRVCRTEGTAAAACSRLVRMANEHGGKDNITAVVVKVI